MKKYSISQFAKKIKKTQQILSNYYNVLERQIENVMIYLISKVYQFKIITDIGSGINYDKKL